jgi:hypothetical protein
MIENHDKERFLLARRLKLLSIFNDIAENDYGSYEDFNEHPDIQTHAYLLAWSREASDSSP